NIDRSALIRALSASVSSVRAARIYQPDIDRLREHGQSTLAALEDFSRVRVGDHTVRITRPVISAAQAEVAMGHALIVGVPGAWKSGAVHDLAEALVSAGHDVVAFAVDQLEGASLG